MSGEKLVEREGFAPCPTCRQYSGSIGDDKLAEAHLHFEMMYAHPVRGHPMGRVFDDKTRDMAQVLLAASRQSTDLIEQLQARLAEAEGVVGDLHSFVAVMVGCGPEATIPATISTPLGIDVKIGEIMRAAASWLAGR